MISTVSGGSFETQKRIIDSAIEAGIPYFVPSEFGQDSLNERVQDRLPPNRERAKTINYLKELAADGRMSWIAAATGVALESGLLNGNLGFDLKWQSAIMHGQGQERFAASSSAWVGRVVVAIIQHWDELQNQYLYAAGMITSANEVVESFEKITGKTFAIGRAYPDECVREAKRRIEQGFPDAGMFLMERSVLYDESLCAVQAFEEDDAKDKLGFDGERLEDVTKIVVHGHEHHGGKADCGCE